MIFINLCKFKKKPTKETTAQGAKIIEERVKAGMKVLGWYWTLGRYDVVFIAEGKDEKAAMSTAIKLSDLVSTETMVALTREEALKLLG